MRSVVHAMMGAHSAYRTSRPHGPECACAHEPSHGHRSPALLFACALALATGLVLGAAGATLGDPPRPVVPLVPDSTPTDEADADARALAVRFYAALETALVTGDTAGLAAVVAPAFVDHTHTPAADLAQEPTATPEWHWMGAGAAAQQTARPDLHLTPVAVLIDGDRAVVYLAVDVARGQSGGIVEVLRIADGHVAERWGFGDAAALWTPSTSTPTWTPPSPAGATSTPIPLGTRIP